MCITHCTSRHRSNSRHNVCACAFNRLIYHITKPPATGTPGRICVVGICKPRECCTNCFWIRLVNCPANTTQEATATRTTRHRRCVNTILRLSRNIISTNIVSRNNTATGQILVTPIHTFGLTCWAIIPILVIHNIELPIAISKHKQVATLSKMVNCSRTDRHLRSCRLSIASRSSSASTAARSTSRRCRRRTSRSRRRLYLTQCLKRGIGEFHQLLCWEHIDVCSSQILNSILPALCHQFLCIAIGFKELLTVLL